MSRRFLAVALISVLSAPAVFPVSSAAQSMPSAETIYERLNRRTVRPPRRYGAREIRRSRKIRSSLPSIDINTINFAFGSSTIGPEERWKVANIARAILRFRRGRGETFLIEGHTDAVGSAASNQLLSEQRAFALKSSLVRWFGVPPRMLITEGYGETELIVDTQKPMRLNRRVTIRRLTDYLR